MDKETHERNSTREDLLRLVAEAGQLGTNCISHHFSIYFS